MNNNKKAKPVERDVPKITRREKEVLDLIMDENTNQEIAGKLFISLKTVEAHRSNLLSKLNKNSQLKRVRRETEHSCSSSSSTCDLSTASKKDQRQSFGFVPITQHDDEMLESGGMFELEVSW